MNALITLTITGLFYLNQPQLIDNDINQSLYIYNDENSVHPLSYEDVADEYKGRFIRHACQIRPQYAPASNTQNFWRYPKKNLQSDAKIMQVGAATSGNYFSSSRNKSDTRTEGIAILFFRSKLRKMSLLQINKKQSAPLQEPFQESKIMRAAPPPPPINPPEEQLPITDGIGVLLLMSGIWIFIQKICNREKYICNKHQTKINRNTILLFRSKQKHTFF